MKKPKKWLKPIQIHHQFKDKEPGMYGKNTKMAAQREIDPDNRFKEMLCFIEDTRASHPLPKDAQWLVVEEGSELFIKQEDEENK